MILRVLGTGALFSGAALVTHIVSGISLRLAWLVMAVILVLAVGSVWRRASSRERVRIISSTRLGSFSGFVATVTYDLAKLGLSQWDPSPYNPFEAIRVFGTLFVGPSGSDTLTLLVGAAYHLFNGISFGIAFCLLFRRRLLITAIGWALFLELFQLTLYPGWLDIRFYREFVQISVLSHVVYGVVLGLLCQHGLRAQDISRKHA